MNDDFWSGWGVGWLMGSFLVGILMVLMLWSGWVIKPSDYCTTVSGTHAVLHDDGTWECLK